MLHKYLVFSLSGLNEDGAQKSYAGVFESVLNVRWENLYKALKEVQSSLRSVRAFTYGGNDEEPSDVLVQKMVDAEYAGVLFTEHPSSSGSMLVELVMGLGESLVGGTATPKSYCFGKYSGELQEVKKAPPIDLRPLVSLGQSVEKLFGWGEE